MKEKVAGKSSDYVLGSRKGPELHSAHYSLPVTSQNED